MTAKSKEVMTFGEFVSKSYTCYHAAENAAHMLGQAGFVNLDAPHDKARTPAGYYRVSGGCLFAAKMGGEGLNMVLSHTDSPSLRITGGTSGNSPVLNTEKYGGGILRSYFDRELKIAGRAVVREGDKLVCRNVCSDFSVVIPSLAIHLGGGSEEIAVSRDMKPLIGECDDLYAAIGAAGAVDGDLYCVAADLPYSAGANGEYICSPRIDNLASVYASLRAISDCDNKSTCAIACYNAEETGSETREGVQSRLVRDFLADCYAAAGKKVDLGKLLGGAYIFSCDGAHALHPARKDKYCDGAPVLGGGIVIKRNDRYATDALTAAVAKQIFGGANVPVQEYRHHPDLRCGTTVGLMAAHVLGANVCDIGIGQLSMHSAVETAAKADIEWLREGLTAFFGVTVTLSGAGAQVKR